MKAAGMMKAGADRMVSASHRAGTAPATITTMPVRVCHSLGAMQYAKAPISKEVRAKAPRSSMTGF